MYAKKHALPMNQSIEKGKQRQKQIN